jgi:hypothetical protein
MTKKRPVKLIKNEERKEPEIQAEVESAANSNKWSKEVRSWVVETQQNRHVESLQAFDSLFNDAPPEAEQED